MNSRDWARLFSYEQVSTLDRGEFFVLQLFRASGYVRLARTERPFEAFVQVVHALDGCRTVLRGVELAHYGILLDWRAPPITTNAELHKVIVRHTDTFAAPFARRAILIRTPVGQMQIARMSRTHSHGPPELFSDEAAAIAYVAWAAVGGSK